MLMIPCVVWLTMASLLLGVPFSSQEGESCQSQAWTFCTYEWILGDLRRCATRPLSKECLCETKHGLKICIVSGGTVGIYYSVRRSTPILALTLAPQVIMISWQLRRVARLPRSCSDLCRIAGLQRSCSNLYRVQGCCNPAATFWWRPLWSCGVCMIQWRPLQGRRDPMTTQEFNLGPPRG